MQINLLGKKKEYSELDLIKKHMYKDIGFESIYVKMVKGDKFLYDNIKNIIFSFNNDISDILYRQEIVKDVINNIEPTLELYKLVSELDNEIKRHYNGIFELRASACVSSCLYLLDLVVKKLKEILEVINLNYKGYNSKGMISLFTNYLKTFNANYLDDVVDSLKYLKIEEGCLVRAKLNKSLDPKEVKLCRYDKTFTNKMKIKFSKKVEILAMDEEANKEFIRILDLGVFQIYKSMYKTCMSLTGFIDKLHLELGFYVCAINLYNEMKNKNLDVCLADIDDSYIVKYEDIRDIALAFTTKKEVIGNTNLNEGKLTMICGANQGGKSTFLRSIGQNQILGQAGLFVAAKSFKTSIFNGLYTHFNKEEDMSMQSGRLDEELKRMSEIVGDIKPYSLVLFNESFSSTNENEGSQIAYDIIKAFYENNINMYFVTHMFKIVDLCSDFNTNYMYASRNSDGSRNYRLLTKKPERSSYALDLYNKLFSNN